MTNRKIHLCFWCKVKKYNFDMVEQVTQNGQLVSMCSVNCLENFHKSIKVPYVMKKICDNCVKFSDMHFQLTMFDGAHKNFCSYPCLLTYQSHRPHTNFLNKRLKKNKNDNVMKLPVISNVQSLAAAQTNGNVEEKKVKQIVMVKPQEWPMQRNMATMVKPNLISKGSTTDPVKTEDKETQTDPSNMKVIIPIPVPIYVPTPVHMYTTPVPFPVPFALPIPVPIFIPTTRNSAKGIMKEINKIKTKVPADPLEAELLMMAELVAEDKKAPSGSSSEDEGENREDLPEPELSTPTNSARESFSEPAPDSAGLSDAIMTMAMDISGDFTANEDLEGAVAASTVTVIGI